VERRLILRREESIPLSNKMGQEILSGINGPLFHQKSPAHIRIMNAKRNAEGAITAITQLNVTAEMAVQYHDIIITEARMVDKAVVDIEDDESRERLMIHAVPLIWHTEQGTAGLNKMREEFEVENECIVISTQVWWLTIPGTIRESRQNGEIALSPVVFIVKGSKKAQSIVMEGIKAVGVGNQVEKYMNEEPDSRCELCCGWGYIESKCGRKPKCGYCSGHHQTSNHKCNVVR